MPLSAVVSLVAQEAARVKPMIGEQAHGLFFALMSDSSPDLATELHDVTGVKPYTLSPLSGRMQTSREMVTIVPEERYWFRATFLNDAIYAPFARGLDASAREVRLGRASFHLETIRAGASQSDAWAGQATFQEISNRADTSSAVDLEFLSPTSFKQGDHDLPLPMPASVFGSWLQRWEVFAGIPISDESRAIIGLKSHGGSCAIAVGRHRIQTKSLVFTKSVKIGFVGRVRFVLPKTASETALRELNALADFAFYCGTGQKTTMGMGQTRRSRARVAAGGSER